MLGGRQCRTFVYIKFLGEPNLSEDEYDIKWSSASLYSGGADATVSSIHALFLALCLFPEVHKKAQVEIDAVVGNDRLPTFEDRQNLPYINALVSEEVLRWHAVTPTSVPIELEDDIHNSCFIPKGSLVIANVWYAFAPSHRVCLGKKTNGCTGSMLHDPRVYHNPMDFKPERFLGPYSSPTHVTLALALEGVLSSDRICPGRILADASVYISVAMLIATFNVSKAVKNGEVVQTSSWPDKWDRQPRSQKAIDLIVDADD
ncbi:cytochrome P450 [Coprinopsis cinerea AmutBmut pab1-1]|nr:cytochrome P450 [Coprinopsis cinerea AmutBmut pab1-1]